MSMQALNLAVEIADREVRVMVECYAMHSTEIDGIRWFDTSHQTCANDDCEQQQALERAVQYIGLRSPDAFPFRFIRHPERPELVRFEDAA